MTVENSGLRRFSQTERTVSYFVINQLRRGEDQPYALNAADLEAIRNALAQYAGEPELLEAVEALVVLAGFLHADKGATRVALSLLDIVAEVMPALKDLDARRAEQFGEYLEAKKVELRSFRKKFIAPGMAGASGLPQN